MSKGLWHLTTSSSTCCWRLRQHTGTPTYASGQFGSGELGLSGHGHGEDTTVKEHLPLKRTWGGGLCEAVTPPPHSLCTLPAAATRHPRSHTFCRCSGSLGEDFTTGPPHLPAVPSRAARAPAAPVPRQFAESGEAAACAAPRRAGGRLGQPRGAAGVRLGGTAATRDRSPSKSSQGAACHPPRREARGAEGTRERGREQGRTATPPPPRSRLAASQAPSKT